MALELRQQLKLTQQLIMTPQLQMAIKLLQLSRLELLDTIQQELEENPALEEIQDVVMEQESTPKEDETEKDNTEIKEVTVEEKLQDDIDWSNYLDEYNSAGKVNFEFEKKDTLSFESFIAHKETLQEHLLWQFLMHSPTEEEERIGSFIIGNLNRDGYLDLTIEEISESNNYDIKKVEEILSLIQTFDPVGICARNLSECLLIQIKHFKLENSIVTDIIDNHLNHLENSNYKALCRALKVNIKDVITAVEIIKSLEPRPGRKFSDDAPQHINPDIFIYKLDNEFVIVLNESGMPKLCVNSVYKQALNNDSKVSVKAKDYLQEKMRSATWLIRSIHQRQKTIYKVMQSILKFQREFFDKGVAYLKPMVLRNVAEDIDMHESTISRVTTNKYAHTPQGIFELKYFFNSSINRIHGEAMASTSVQEKIKQIIESENVNKPFSDNQIANILKDSNINIARRTVAKYREMMRILPSSKRKKYLT